MGKGIFITAADTECGKTMCGCAISEILRSDGIDVGVYKPVLSGAPIKDGVKVREDALMLKEAARSDDDIDIINPYCFSPAVTPAHAACMEDVLIDKKLIIERYDEISARHDITVVEGAGGLMVPVTDDYLIVDLIRDLGLNALVITDTNLGRINHTLMTMKVLDDYNIDALGIIVNRYPKDPGEKDKSLIKYLKMFNDTRILGVVPEIAGGDGFYEKFVSVFNDNIDTVQIEKVIHG